MFSITSVRLNPYMSKKFHVTSIIGKVSLARGGCSKMLSQNWFLAVYVLKNYLQCLFTFLFLRLIIISALFLLIAHTQISTRCRPTSLIWWYRFRFGWPFAAKTFTSLLLPIAHKVFAESWYVYLTNHW